MFSGQLISRTLENLSLVYETGYILIGFYKTYFLIYKSPNNKAVKNFGYFTREKFWF